MNDAQTASGFFYGQRDQRTRYTANKVLRYLLSEVAINVESMVDVGCGVGTWLAVGNELGVREYEGFEGAWVDLGALVIPRNRLNLVDLETDWMLEREYDLGVCLEVAEHLTPKSGERLVENLVSRCGVVLFSAATPGQGGNGHINEQWPIYWQELFNKYGYVALDCVRNQIWYDQSVPWWYRENLIVYTSSAVALSFRRRSELAGVAFQDPPVIGALTRRGPAEQDGQAGKRLNGLTKLAKSFFCRVKSWN